MLIALMTIYFFGGGGVFGPVAFIDEALDNVDTAIVDDDQSKAVTTALKSMNKRSNKYTKAVKGPRKELNSAFGTHEATPEQIEAIWKNIFELNAEYSKDFVELRFELRDQLSRDEWEALFPSETVSDS